MRDRSEIPSGDEGAVGAVADDVKPAVALEPEGEKHGCDTGGAQGTGREAVVAPSEELVDAGGNGNGIERQERQEVTRLFVGKAREREERDPEPNQDRPDAVARMSERKEDQAGETP